jgi:hypothetical protein
MGVSTYPRPAALDQLHAQLSSSSCSCPLRVGWLTIAQTAPAEVKRFSHGTRYRRRFRLGMRIVGRCPAPPPEGKNEQKRLLID